MGDSRQHIPEVAASGGIHASSWLILGSDMGRVFASVCVCVAHMNMRGGAMKELHLCLNYQLHRPYCELIAEIDLQIPFVY